MLPSPYLIDLPPVEREPRWFWPRGRVLLCFAAGLLGVVGLLRLFTEPFDVPEIEGKLKWLSKHGEQYDTFFFGSSRVGNHINPALFDQIMAQGGIPTRSFNMGVSGAYAPEDTLIMKLFLAQRRTPLRFVMVESFKTDPYFLERPDKKNTLRARFWRKPRGVGDLFAPALRLRQRYEILLSYAQDFFLTGRKNTLESRFKKRPRDYNGWRYQTRENDMNITQRDWEKLRLQLLHSEIIPQNGSPEDERELAKKMTLLKPFGARLFALYSPLNPANYFTPDLACHPGLTFFQFYDPAAYPEFFLRENLSNINHFNKKGATVYTRKLAEAVLKSLPR